MSDVLFEITKDNLETGLRGYPIGYCTTSTVDPAKGLAYANIPAIDLVDWTPESVIYLLYHGRKGTDQEVKELTEDLRKRAKLSPEVGRHIKLLPRSGHPIHLFCIALLICGMYECKGDYREDCLNVIAKIPELTAILINYHAGWGETKASKPELGYMENFTQMLNVPKANKEELNFIFRVFNILHYDHGGGNLSTFVGKAVASGLADMYGSLNGAMAALAGPRHGRANQDALEFVKGVLAEVGENATPEVVEALLRKKLANNALIFGFGHAVLRVEDPRAIVFYKIAEERYPNHPLVKITHLLRSEAPKVLGENPKITNPYPNIDAISGTVLTAAGFPYPEYYTVLFGLGRVVGIAMQIVYERCEAREGKGTPIVRPKYFYKGRT